MKKTVLLLLFQLFVFILLAQDILPADHKRVKKGQLSYDYTEYTMHEGFNIPAMRVPDKEIYAVKSPAAAFLIRTQNLLQEAKIAHENQREILKLDDIQHNITQVKALDGYWEAKFLELEYQFYADYEKKRYEREVVAVQKATAARQKQTQRRADSLNLLFITENQLADSLERARVAYLATRKDSIIRVDRYAGYHFVNVKSLDLRAAPSSNAPLIVSVRACSYLQKLSQPDANGYVFVEVSDYKGYVLNGLLVDNLNKIAVAGADVKFARENYFVSIYVPAGSTYDPLRQQGDIPKAISPDEYRNNPNALSELVAKLERENKLPKEKKNNNPVAVKEPEPRPEIRITPTENPVAQSTNQISKSENLTTQSENRTVKSENNDTKKKKTTHSNRKQCTILLPDGIRCPNVTTSNSCRCYLHDN